MTPRLVTRGGWLVGALALATLLVAAARHDGARQLPPDAAGPSAPSPAPAWSPEAVDQAARGLPRLHSLLVSRHGELIFERYYNGARRDRPANIKSASKSLISALVGIAFDRGLLPGLDTRIVTFFPELRQDPDGRKQQITIEHLLSMRSGLEGTSNRNYGAWVTSRNWVRHVLARPMFAAPGEEMEYSTGNTHLLSAILTKVTGKSTWQFANETLARPLGFALPAWPRDPQGIYFGGNDMLMTPRQMLAFGELYLHRGRAAGRQIVPEKWVEQSCEGRTRRWRSWMFDPVRGFDPLRDRRYGLGWWVHEIREQDTCFAWGYGGQYIFVFPDLALVVVTTSSPDVSEERRGHRRLLFEILDERIIAPAAGQM